MENTGEMELLGRITAGDENAFEELLGRHAGVVYNLAIRTLLSPAEAEEVVSSVFLSLWTESRRGGKGPRDIRTWLLSRARSEILPRIRVRQNEVPDYGVDLRNAAARLLKSGDGQGGGENAESFALAALVCDLDYLRLKILSLAYFGGYGVTRIAAILDLTPRDCIARLHDVLDLLARPRNGDRRPVPAHEVTFSGYTAPYALGCLDGSFESDFRAHLNRGCTACTAEIRRFADVAHRLPLLLPEVSFSADLPDKILFSLRLALIVGGQGPPEGAGEGEDDLPPPVVHPASRRRYRGAATLWVLAGIVGFIAGSGLYISSLMGMIEDQAMIIDMQQDRAAELMVRNDRLEGISMFLENPAGVVVLKSPDGTPDFGGRILFDTGGRSALLQVFGLPGEFQGRDVEVSVGAPAGIRRIAAFRLVPGDTGRSVYKYFHLSGGDAPDGGELSLDVIEKDMNGLPLRRTILRGTRP